MAKASPSNVSDTAATMAGAGHHYAIVADGGRQYRVGEG